MAVTSRLTTLLVSLFFTTILFTPKAYNYVPLCLAIMALLLIVNTFRSLKSPPFKKVSLALFSYPLLILLSLLVFGGKFSQLDMPSRTILAIPIIALLVTYPPKKSVVFFSIASGAIIVGVIAIVQVVIFKYPRAFSYNGYMSIQIGGIVASLSVFSLITFFYYLKKAQKFYAVYAAIGFLAAALACLLSGARGAWVLTPFVVITILGLQWSLLSKKIVVILLIALGIIAVAAYPQLKIRIAAMHSDIVLYENNNSNTSSGARLEMWKSAILLGIEKPLFGQGYLNLMKKKQKQVQEGKVDKIVLLYTRVHNQYLEAFQIQGLVGVMTLLAFFLVPFYYLVRQHRQVNPDSEQYYFSLMGAAHIVLIMGYCLTQHYLAHNSGIIFYSMGVAIFMALSFPFLSCKETE